MFCKVNKKALPKQGFSRSTDLLGGADDFDIDAAIRLQASNDFGALTTFALTWLRNRLLAAFAFGIDAVSRDALAHQIGLDRSRAFF